MTMKKPSDSGRWTSVLLIAVALCTVSLLGLLIGAELYVLIALLGGGLLALPLLYAGVFGIEDRSGWLFAATVGVMLIAFAGTWHGVPVGYLMEAAIFGFMLSSVRKLWQLARDDGALRCVLALFALYLACAVASTLLGRSNRIAALWQLQYNLKVPLAFALGMLIVYNERTAATLRLVVGATWPFFLFFVLAEAAVPGIYSKIMGASTDYHVNPVLGLSVRLRGPFSHSGYLAMYAAVMAAAACVIWMQGRGRKWLLVTAIYCGMLVASGQRQETLALVLVFGLLFCIGNRRRPVLLAMTAFVLLGALAFAGMWMEHMPFGDLAAEWSGSARHLSERAILTQNGLIVADRYFPLGSGLGTYGGAGAQKFDLSLFVELGFTRYWWFRQGLFTVDTYWPSVMAESGYFGALLMLLTFVAIWWVLLRRSLRADGEGRTVLLMALSGITLLLANSPTSAAISDPRGAMLVWLLAGCAWRWSVPLAAAVPRRQRAHVHMHAPASATPAFGAAVPSVQP